MGQTPPTILCGWNMNITHDRCKFERAIRHDANNYS